MGKLKPKACVTRKFPDFFGSIPKFRKSGLDLDVGSLVNPVEQNDHVVVPKTNTSVAGRGSDEVLLIGSVDVNVALTGIGVLRIESFKPEDSSEHEILVPSLFRNLSGRNTASEDHPCRGALADLLRYPEASRGCPETPLLESESEP